MNDKERGRIRNREYAKQLKDFSGLRWEKITPTDIDGFADFGNRAFVFIECKHGSCDLPYGQKLALQRVCDACEKGGVASIVIVANHDDSCETDIDVASQPVTLIRIRQQWRKPKSKQTVKEAIDGFLGWAEKRQQKKGSASNE